MARNPFIETDQGVFVPTADVVNIAGRMTARETAINYAVEDWLIVESTSAPVGQASKAYYPVPNRPPSTILRCRLRNDGRRLHALRAESDALIEADLELDIQATQDGTSSGSFTHYPRSEPSEGGEHQAGHHEERVWGRLLIAQDRFQFIVERLKQPNARLAVMIKLPLYKSALAHETDTESMRQDLYLRHGETVPITGYGIEVVFEPRRRDDEAPRKARDPEEWERGTPPVLGAEPQSSPSRRVEWLLAMIAALVLIIVLLALIGG